MKTVGERLKDLRTKQKLSQEEVSNILGTSKQTIHKYEKNIIENIPLDRIETLAKLYDTTPSYITGWEEKELTCPIIFNEEPQEPQKQDDPLMVVAAHHSDYDFSERQLKQIDSFINFVKQQEESE